tara:strand:+ start:218 stop:460 length:243 start_codon:yes stop_codon:yes gene_type:complete
MYKIKYCCCFKLNESKDINKIETPKENNVNKFTINNIEKIKRDSFENNNNNKTIINDKYYELKENNKKDDFEDFSIIDKN